MAKRSSFVGTGTRASLSDVFPFNFFFRSSRRRVRDGACDRAVVRGTGNEVVNATGGFSGTVSGTVLGTVSGTVSGTVLGTGVGVGAIGREGMVLGG